MGTQLKFLLLRLLPFPGIALAYYGAALTGLTPNGHEGIASFMLAGTLLGVLVVFIVRLRRLEATAQEMDLRFRQVLEHTEEVFFMAAPDLQSFLYISPSYEKVWGQSRDVVYKNPLKWIQTIHKEDRRKVLKVARRGYQDEGVAFEYRIVRPDGSERWIRSRLVGLKNEAGVHYRSVGFSEDITEQKEAESALKETHDELERRVEVRTADLVAANQRLKQEIGGREQVEAALRSSESVFASAIQTSPDSILITRLSDGKVLRMNQGFMRLSGYTETEAVGKTAADLRYWVNPEDREQFARVLRATGECINQETTLRMKDGRIVPALMSGRLIEHEGEKHIFSITRDISGRKQAEEALRAAKEAAEAANRAKSDFLANMSHEIRTPMNGVIGMTNLVLDTELDKEQREYLDMAKFSAESLMKVINDILDFSKVEAGKLDLELITFDLRKSIADTTGSLKVKAEEKGIELTCDISSDVPDAVVGDPARLNQVVVNLIGNAIKFTEAGYVTVRVRVDSLTEMYATIRIEVSDTGIGIPKSKQQEIFAAFAQADGSTTRQHGGTGLGLAISSQLASLMGGRIWVESEQGVGSCFHLTARLGIAASGAEIKERWPSEVTEAASHGPLHILVAEDNVINQRLTTGLLKNQGHTCRVAGNGNEVLATLEQERFDLVFMDVQMPGMDGLEATHRIRQTENDKGGHMPIVAMTAHAMEGDRERCLSAGMDAYLSKPVQPDQITGVLAQLLGEGSTAKPPEAVEAGFFDMNELLKRVGGDMELLEEIYGLFLEDYPKMLKDTLQAIEAGDGEAVSRCVHRIKGAVGNFSASGAVQAAVRLEEMAHKDDLEAFREVYDVLAEEIEQLKISLGRTLGRS